MKIAISVMFCLCKVDVDNAKYNLSGPVSSYSIDRMTFKECDRLVCLKRPHIRILYSPTEIIQINYL